MNQNNPFGTNAIGNSPNAQEQEAINSDSKNSIPEQEFIELDINTDGKKAFDWKSKYPDDARKEMRIEAIYIGLVLVVSLAGIFLNWSGFISCWLKIEKSRVLSFEGIVLYFFSGLTGGTIFGIKYFYRVIARGFWSQDRKYWRIFSPWISACIALVVGCMVVSDYIKTSRNPSTAMNMFIGFLSGYFADEAVGKMSEVAKALFGSNNAKK